MKRILISTCLYTASLVGIIFPCSQLKSETVVLGGSFSLEGYDSRALVETYSIGKERVSLINFPAPNFGGIVSSSVIPSGLVFFGGSYAFDNFSPYYPFIAVLKPRASSATVLSVPDLSVTGQIASVAANSSGTAIFGGSDAGSQAPLMYRIDAGSLTVTSITTPPMDQGYINSVSIYPDGSAILGGGGSGGGSLPLIYGLAAGATTSTTINNPNSNNGEIYSSVIDTSGAAILSGADYTNNVPLIYKVVQGATTATLLDNPISSSGSINASAVALDGSIVFGGVDGSGSPLIYRLTLGSTMATLVNIPASIQGYIISVAIGPDGTAYLAGINNDSNLPLIYQLQAGSNNAVAIPTTDMTEGLFFSVAVASDGTAVFGGQNGITNEPCAYQLNPGSSAAFPLNTPNLSVDLGYINTIAIYENTSRPAVDLEGLYNINRISLIYDIELIETKHTLNQAGIP